MGDAQFGLTDVRSNLAAATACYNSSSPNGRLLRVDPASGNVTTLAAGFAAPNAIAQDRHRNLFAPKNRGGLAAIG